MGIQDRDYMRNRAPDTWQERALGFVSTTRGKLIVGAALVAVLGAGIWLNRKPPGEGSLVVNINTATQQELETLPDIGPAKAVKIIAGRPYASVEDLLRVNGIGEYTLESLKPFVTVEGDTETRK